MERMTSPIAAIRERKRVLMNFENRLRLNQRLLDFEVLKSGKLFLLVLYSGINYTVDEIGGKVRYDCSECKNVKHGLHDGKVSISYRIEEPSSQPRVVEHCLGDYCAT